MTCVRRVAVGCTVNESAAPRAVMVATDLLLRSSLHRLVLTIRRRRVRMVSSSRSLLSPPCLTLSSDRRRGVVEGQQRTAKKKRKERETKKKRNSETRRAGGSVPLSIPISERTTASPHGQQQTARRHTNRRVHAGHSLLPLQSHRSTAAAAAAHTGAVADPLHPSAAWAAGQPFPLCCPSAQHGEADVVSSHTTAHSMHR